MALVDNATWLGETFPWPDPMLRTAIGLLVSRTDRRLSRAPANSVRLFAEAMGDYPVAMHAADANAQHYELPERFFRPHSGAEAQIFLLSIPDG